MRISLAISLLAVCALNYSTAAYGEDPFAGATSSGEAAEIEAQSVEIQPEPANDETSSPDLSSELYDTSSQQEAPIGDPNYVCSAPQSCETASREWESMSARLSDYESEHPTLARFSENHQSALVKDASQIDEIASDPKLDSRQKASQIQAILIWDQETRGISNELFVFDAGDAMYCVLAYCELNDKVGFERDTLERLSRIRPSTLVEIPAPSIEEIIQTYGLNSGVRPEVDRCDLDDCEEIP